MKHAFLLLMIVMAVGNLAHADGMKIASVDIRKIFEKWSYSIETQERMEKAKQRLESENNDRLAVINQHRMLQSKMGQEFRANQASMSEEEKKKISDQFLSLGRDAAALEQDRRDFYEKGNRAIANEQSSEAKLILDRIIQFVQVYALEGKYHMVIEMGGHTTRNVPLFMHLEGAEDITDEIIKRLNESAGN